MTEMLLGHFLGGVIVGLVVTRLGIGLARRAGWLDYPDCQRKLHCEAVPIGGGIAVFVTTLIVLVVGHQWLNATALWTHAGSEMAGLLGACIIIVLLGAVDDRYSLPARYKLLGQLVAVMIWMIWSQCLITRVGFLGWTIDFGVLAVPVTLFWLLACINALNLIDGMDAMLGTVASIALASFGILAILAGQQLVALIAFSMLGAVLGFLWWNWPPARIYMGDAGSMLIGLVVGTLAIQTSLKGPATIALAAPIAILVLPLLDTTAAVIRRKLTGRGLATPDRGHLHHVLLRQGLTARRVILLVAILATLAASGGLASIAWHNDLYALISTIGVVITLIASKLFGYAEWMLLQKRVSTTIQALFRAVLSQQGQELAIHLQGAAPWGVLWRDLVATAQRLGLDSICLDVNAPAWHENFHARWYRNDDTPCVPQWRLEVPLLFHDHPWGRLIVSVRRNGQSLKEPLRSLVTLIETAEQRAADWVWHPHVTTATSTSSMSQREQPTWETTPLAAKG
jgi:UDP-GlcNAc:undecaprenyl-phosphate GlcNAc-1-phosphate transferase